MVDLVHDAGPEADQRRRRDVVAVQDGRGGDPGTELGRHRRGEARGEAGFRGYDDKGAPGGRLTPLSRSGERVTEAPETALGLV